jgi:hypothetical protein
MEIGQVTEGGAMAQVHLFLTTDQQNVYSAMLLHLWWHKEKLRHAELTGGVILLAEHPLSTGVSDYAETPCMTLL